MKTKVKKHYRKCRNKKILVRQHKRKIKRKNRGAYNKDVRPGKDQRRELDRQRKEERFNDLFRLNEFIAREYERNPITEEDSIRLGKLRKESNDKYREMPKHEKIEKRDTPIFKEVEVEEYDPTLDRFIKRKKMIKEDKDEKD